MRVSLSIDGADEVRKRLLDAGDRLAGSFKTLFEAVGASWEASFKGHVRDEVDVFGEAFQPLAASTMRRRKKEGFPPANPILRRRGDLFTSIRALEITDTELLVGTDHASAGLLNYGGRTSSASLLPDRPVPARRFIGLNGQEVDDLFETLADFLLGDAAPGASRA